MTRKRLAATSPRLRIHVPTEIIDASVLRDSSHCMIAETIQQAVPNARHIMVDLATIRFSDLTAGRRYIYLTPVKAQQALVDFDQGKKPAPFTITLQGAHVVATGTARKGRATLRASSVSQVPIRVGGEAPPLGPLAYSVDGPGPGVPARRRHRKAATAPAEAAEPVAPMPTGRRREFGLRQLVR